MKSNDLLEKLARLEHLQWIEWTKYMLSNLTTDNINRWKKQLETDYNDLSSKEKWSDKRWAKKVLELISRN